MLSLGTKSDYEIVARHLIAVHLKRLKLQVYITQAQCGFSFYLFFMGRWTK